MSLPFRFARRLEVDNRRSTSYRVGGAVVGLIASGLLLLITSRNPFKLFGQSLDAIFGSQRGIEGVLVQSVPILMCALGVALSLRMKVWNIGSDGQFLMGAFAAVGVGTKVGGPHWLLIILMACAATAAGAMWIGASTPGMAVAGEAKLGFLPHDSLLPGPLGLMSKSGTLSYESGYRLAQAGIGEEVHPRVVLGVVAHEVAFVGDPSRAVGERLRPASLDEEGRAHAELAEAIEEKVLLAHPVVRPVGMLGVEGERDAEAVHRSSPSP